MKIIIIGCGKVGSTLAIQLCKENHDICVIDTNHDRLNTLVSSNDIIGICGNGSDYSVLSEAGITEAHLLIAVTESDELNLLCCVIAGKAKSCSKIARVRNPIYEENSNFLQEQLGLSMIINPELLAAQEMFQLLCFPNATQISMFSTGQAQILRYTIPKDSALEHMSLKEVSSKVEKNMLICAVERGSDILIPNGDTILYSGDQITILTTRAVAIDFFNKIKASVHPVKDTMIVGGGRIAFYLAKMLYKVGIHVKIIEQNAKRCEELSMILPDTVIINGDGINEEILKEEHIDKMDSLVALTNYDEENILLSLFAKKKVRRKVVTKINRFQLSEVVEGLDLDSVVYPKNLTSERILQYVRSKQNSIGSNKIQTLYRLHNSRVESLEFLIETESAITNVELSKLKIHSDILIGCIIRNGKTIIPGGNDKILLGDTVIIITSKLGLWDAIDILKD